MKVSYKRLNTYFDGKLPSPRDVAEALTFHSWEIEETIEKGSDTIFDVKVLPDKTPWALSHRGIAKDLSVVLNIPLSHDPLREKPVLEPKTDSITITIESPGCRRYIAAHITDVKVGPSPVWLVEYLAALGQRSINNIVDATNYVMFELGQPLHAFDAQKLSNQSILVRSAHAGEDITVLTGETYSLSPQDLLIVDKENDVPIGIAGIKGGKAAEIDEATSHIILESANFEPVLIRKSSQRLRLRTDASVRFENGIVSEMAAYGIEEAVRLILEIAGGSLVGYMDSGETSPRSASVTVTLPKACSVLGVTLTQEDVETIMSRFGYEYAWQGTTLTVHPPFERTDLIIPEDVIEEIGRIHGYEHVASITPEPVSLPQVNAAFYYTNKVRDALITAGFSEVFTSSFRNKDAVKLKNALASDKAYLRSALGANMREVLSKNAPNIDLLGMRDIRAFEIGTIFTKEKETLSLALGVSGPSGFSNKQHAHVLAEGKAAVESILGALAWKEGDGIAEAPIDEALALLPEPKSYDPIQKRSNITYKPYSAYPFIARDIALWVPEGTNAEIVGNLIREHAGPLLVRLSLFDEFKKEGNISYAFRLVFQSYERTLTDEEISPIMKTITNELAAQTYTVR